MEIQTTVQPYLDELAAGTAAPGGGSAAAATGAMGAALVCMVCNLTIGRSKFADVDVQMRTILSRAEALRAELTQLISDDPAAYSSVMDAYRLPKETAPEKAERSEAIQASTKQATLTPLATARACAEVLDLCRSAAELGNPNAVSDVGAGAACAQAGLKAAALNVLINLPSIHDEQFVVDCQSQLNQILLNLALADEVHELVKSQIA